MQFNYFESGFKRVEGAIYELLSGFSDLLFGQFFWYAVRFVELN